MTVINGVEVAIAECDKCHGREWWIYKGMNGQGYKFNCANPMCHQEDRNFNKEFKVPYLWSKQEISSHD
jgi:hypothetical protein